MTTPVAAPASFATSADYVDLVGPVPTGVDIDELLTAASAAIRRYCRWHVAPARDETFIVDGSGGRDLMLPTLALNSLTSVTEDGTTLTNLEWTVNGWLRKPSGCWTSKLRGVTVEVNHGFDHYYDLTELTCRIAARASITPVGVLQEQALTQSVRYASAGGVMLMVDERADLDGLRLRAAL